MPIRFPDPSLADEAGCLGYGGDLEPKTLLEAYRSGIFPWFSEGEPILWWSPNPRFVLLPSEFRLSKRALKRLEKTGFEVRLDMDFRAVIEACATIPRSGQAGTWIVPEMRAAYARLFEMGYAHSLEVYSEGELVGGLYGVSLGAAFFGESMFSRLPEASRVAFYALHQIALSREWELIDCQIYSEHLARLGARNLAREEFLARLKKALTKPTWRGKWS